MASRLYDPTPTDTEYALLRLTRPLTDPAMGNPRRRGRDARLSARMHGYERPRRDTHVVKSPWTGRIYTVTSTIR